MPDSFRHGVPVSLQNSAGINARIFGNENEQNARDINLAHMF